MAPRPCWKGYLKLSLVTCPMQIMPATSESETVKFHTVNRLPETVSSASMSTPIRTYDVDALLALWNCQDIRVSTTSAFEWQSPVVQLPS